MIIQASSLLSESTAEVTGPGKVKISMLKADSQLPS